MLRKKGPSTIELAIEVWQGLNGGGKLGFAEKHAESKPQRLKPMSILLILCRG
jgi:hypothetical protein